MTSYSGPTMPALVLLCWVGTWLSVYTFPTGTPSPFLIGTPGPCEIQQILEDLNSRSTELLENYEREETELLKHHNSMEEKYPVPCFTPGLQAVHSISVVKAYLQKTNRSVSEVLEQLDKLQYEEVPAPQVPEPTSNTNIYEIKNFILTILRQFSACIQNTHDKFKKRLEAEGRTCD